MGGVVAHFLVGPHSKDYSILGSILFFGKLPSTLSKNQPD